jgi:hypothetical protein
LQCCKVIIHVDRELDVIIVESYGRRVVKVFSVCLSVCLCVCVVLNDVICASFQDKGSSDKRGWSFRKRSVRHRVLSNTVISETPSSGNKESLEAVNVNYQQPVNTNVPEKISVIQSIDEKPQLSTSADPKVLELLTSVEPKVIELSTSAEPTKVIETVVTTENESKLDVYPEESVVIVIQSAIRGFLVFSLSNLYGSRTY